MGISDLNEQYLYPGGLIVSESPLLVTTILGSCVSLCLWDPVNHIGGINHFMLPLWNGEGLATPRYGSIAAEKLLKRMLELGSNQKTLVAKIFGGARVLQVINTRLDIGRSNILFVEKFLMENDIQIASRHTGGDVGRKIKFQTDTGVVMMKLLSKNQTIPDLLLKGELE